MKTFECHRCHSSISIADNERPWGITVLFPQLAEVPICLQCINEVKPPRYAVLGSYPFYEPPQFEPLSEYGKMAESPAEIESAERELFGDSIEVFVRNLFNHRHETT